jgi:predicted small metal-binding protein
MATTVFDCARVPGDTCSVQIVGERKEVLEAAQHHMASVHNHTNGAQLKKNVANAVKEPPAAPTPYSTWI